jgi:hypothetical protein
MTARVFCGKYNVIKFYFSDVFADDLSIPGPVMEKLIGSLIIRWDCTVLERSRSVIACLEAVK